MIKIITVGKIKENYLKEAINDYQKRINKYHKLEIIEIEDDNIINEKDRILKYINKKDYLIALDIQGIELTSIELSKKIDNIFINNSNITTKLCFFVISITTLLIIIEGKASDIQMYPN